MLYIDPTFNVFKKYVKKAEVLGRPNENSESAFLVDMYYKILYICK